MPSSSTVRRAALTLLLLGGCGGGDGAITPAKTDTAVLTVPRTKQQPLTDAEWQKELTAAPDLKTLADATGQPLQAAGVIEDQDGNRLIWAEFAPDAGAPRAAVQSVYRLCTKVLACSAGKATYTDAGATLQDATSAAVVALAIGVPVLHKEFKNHDLANPNTVLAPLSRSYQVDRVLANGQADAGGFKTRRFIVLSAFGPQVGVSVQPVVDAAKKLGLYDSVLAIDFARRADLEAIAPTLTPLDVLVWLGAGVKETVSGVVHPAGLTLSRGVLGDEMVHVKQIKDLLSGPALGGPGLVVLAGTGTGSATGGDAAALSTPLMSGPMRPVVGFAGTVAPAEAIAAVAALVAQLGAGKDLETALLAVGHGMASPLDKAARQKWKLPGKADAFWAKVPTAAHLTVFLKNDALCSTDFGDVCDPAHFKDATDKQAVQAAAATFDCDPTFTGPWLECSGTNAAIGQDFKAKGVLLGLGAGDHMMLYITGSASKQIQDITVVGDAVFDKPDVGGGASSLHFTGPAAASTYINDAGQCCWPKQPLLQSTDSKPGTLHLSN